MIDYANELNPSQRDAVLYTEGHCMVIAGAGSGKTRVLTYRIAHLLEMGIDPWSILALTFTNKAAGEMKERIAAKVGEQKARYLWMGTFHSIFSRILRTEAESIGYTRDFTIYDTTDSQNLIKSIVREMQLDEKAYKPNVVLSRISNAKNRLMGAQDYLSNQDIWKNDQFKRIPMTGKIYERYAQRCRQANAMDFDDLLVQTFTLFRDNPDILEKYATQYRHILVDEYQDTNYAQHCIVWQLTRYGATLCVVGDDAQSIYSFRGANIDNMLKFQKLYPGSRMFKLEQNYRSTRTIVGAAGSLIEHNHAQIQKNVFSENEEGDKIKVMRTHSDIEESEVTVNRLLDLHTFNDVPWREMAILYRTNAQSRSLEEALRKRGLPYRIYGSLSFYQRKEIKDVLSYFRMTINPNDEEAFKRIINYPARGIGQTTINKIAMTAGDEGTSLWNVTSHPGIYRLDVNGGTRAKLDAFVTMMESFMQQASALNARDLASMIVDGAGIMKDLKADVTVEGESRVQNLEQLMAGVDSFVSGRMEEGNEKVFMVDYLNDVALMTDQDTDSDEDVEKVTLMTVHAAKGLEFDSVCITGLEEDLFPSNMGGDGERQIEEERRLFYVAMTRARKYLMLSYATSRFRFGSTDFCEPSRFLKDIDGSFLLAPSGAVRQAWGTGRSMYADESSRPVFQRKSSTSQSGTSVSQSKPAFSQPGFTGPRFQPVEQAKPWQRGKAQVATQEMLEAHTGASDSKKLQVGSVIEHDRFGIGSVLEIAGCGDSTKIRVRFLNCGEKTLLTKFANIKILK